MRKIIFILVLCVAFFRCSKDDTNIPSNNNQEASVKVKKIIEADQTLEVFYDGNKITSNVWTENTGKVTKYEFIYENGKVVRQKKYVNGIYQTNKDWVYIYSGNNITTATGDDYGILTTNQYIYNNLGQITEESEYDNGVYCCTNTYTYLPNGNMESYSNDGSSPEFYSYNDKIDPWFYTKPLELSKTDGVSKNLIIFDYVQYEYNSKGLLIKKISDFGGGNIENEYYEYY